MCLELVMIKMKFLNMMKQNDKDEVFEYDEATRKIISDYFSKVKIAASNAQ